MKVAQLEEILRQFPHDAEVVFEQGQLKVLANPIGKPSRPGTETKTPKR
jgi:hypothetical protein